MYLVGLCTTLSQMFKTMFKVAILFIWSPLAMTSGRVRGGVRKSVNMTKCNMNKALFPRWEKRHSQRL